MPVPPSLLMSPCGGRGSDSARVSARAHAATQRSHARHQRAAQQSTHAQRAGAAWRMPGAACEPSGGRGTHHDHHRGESGSGHASFQRAQQAARAAAGREARCVAAASAQQRRAGRCARQEGAGGTLRARGGARLRASVEMGRSGKRTPATRKRTCAQGGARRAMRASAGEPRQRCVFAAMPEAAAQRRCGAAARVRAPPRRRP